MSRYYTLLKEKFPSKSQILTELINLDAICHLPKGTEHFLSDVHGEYKAFDYLLRNGSGTVRRKVTECFPEKSRSEIEELCLFIYYPEEKIHKDISEASSEDEQVKLLQLLPDLLALVQYIGSKYTQSKIRKMMPARFTYIMEELLSERIVSKDKTDYVKAIIDRICRLQQLESLVTALAYLIQQLTIDHLHIVGDIYDRGKEPDRIIDRLIGFAKVDIQWGNHDVTWMGAVSGSYICMVNVIRIAARYNNLNLLEERYGINLRRLIQYSQNYYRPCAAFSPILDGDDLSRSEAELLNNLQQAAAILQFKLEHQLIKRRPEFHLDSRKIFDKINFDRQQFRFGSESLGLKDFNTACIDFEKPEALTDEEASILQELMHSFQHSEHLKKHVDFLFSQGSMYLISNNHLLYHGCIPMHNNGDFKSFRYKGNTYMGRSLLDFFEQHIRQAYQEPNQHNDFATDLFWYLWVGDNSSLFGKERMATFERYYIADKRLHQELKNPYYRLRNRTDICQSILEDFGLGLDAHIVNGHTPVIEKKGENPIKAEGRLIIIDGGMAKGYQKKTGIAGYTLISNSYGLELVAHHPFTSIDDILNGQGDIIFTKRLVEGATHRILVGQTDVGQRLAEDIKDLEYLYQHFEKY